MHYISWYHCSKDTTNFPGLTSPLKVLIWGEPILSLAMSKLRRWLMSAADWGGYWLPWELAIPHPFSHLGSTSPSLGTPSLLPPGTFRFPQGDPNGGVTSPLLAILFWRASNALCNWSSSRYQMSLVNSLQDVENWASNKPSSELGTWGGGYTPTVLLWICAQAAGGWAPLMAI